MSLRKGNSEKKGQRHQNAITFKIDKYGVAKGSMRLKQLKLAVGGVCEKCKAVLEWKKKCDKYKPLTAPARCGACQQKTITHAYHILCQPCAAARAVCAKCGKDDQAVPPVPTEKDLQQRTVEEQAMLDAMSERERRSYLRKKEKKAGKKKGDGEGGDGKRDDSDDSDSESGSEGGGAGGKEEGVMKKEAAEGERKGKGGEAGGEEEEEEDGLSDFEGLDSDEGDD